MATKTLTSSLLTCAQKQYWFNLMYWIRLHYNSTKFMHVFVKGFFSQKTFSWIKMGNYPASNYIIAIIFFVIVIGGLSMHYGDWLTVKNMEENRWLILAKVPIDIIFGNVNHVDTGKVGKMFQVLHRMPQVASGWIIWTMDWQRHQQVRRKGVTQVEVLIVAEE